MKTQLRVLLLCTVGLVGQQALAATVSATFNASVTLNSVCRVKTGSDNQTLTFGTYDAFQGTPKAATSINIDFECTRGFAAAPTVAFDTGTNMTSTASAATATGAGVVAGLNYTLAVAAGVNTPGTAATTTGIGTPDTYRYAVSGSMPAGQAGTNSTGVQTQVRLLTITY
jgi:ABC-type thiamine transport system substrate-binding protein